MADYTARFTEQAMLLADIAPASHSTEQNTGYVSVAGYHRVFVLIHSGTLGGNLGIDMEQATDTAGTSAKALDAGGKDVDLVATTDDDEVNVIEIRTEELDVPNGFDCLNVEATPASAGIFGVQIWGFVPRHAPPATTALGSVTD